MVQSAPCNEPGALHQEPSCTPCTWTLLLPLQGGESAAELGRGRRAHKHLNRFASSAPPGPSAPSLPPLYVAHGASLLMGFLSQPNSISSLLWPEEASRCAKCVGYAGNNTSSAWGGGSRWEREKDGQLTSHAYVRYVTKESGSRRSGRLPITSPALLAYQSIQSRLPRGSIISQSKQPLRGAASVGEQRLESERYERGGGVSVKAFREYLKLGACALREGDGAVLGGLGRRL